MKKPSLIFLSVLFSGLPFSAGRAAAAPLEELQALAASSPENYGRIFDKSLASATAGAPAAMTQQQLKQLMLRDLDSVRDMIAARYAPAGWKTEQYGWDLDAEIQKAKEQVNASDSFGVRDYQKTLKTLLNSMKDYHVSVSFHSTEVALLPFSVTEAGGRYFISAINRKAMPENLFPFQVGDELTAFDGKPVGEVVAALKKQAGMNNIPHTDVAMAVMMSLTTRGAMMGDTVPQGPVSISVKSAGAQEPAVYPMKWTYIPEYIAPQPFVTKSAGPRIPMDWLGTMMLETPSAYGAADRAPYSLGDKNGFLPDFGEKLWTAPAGNSFKAYVYRSPASGRSIGYVRIPTYGVADPGKFASDFAALIPEFNQRAEALVIDQANNPGGIVLYLYSLASMLTDAPLTLPKHYISLTQSDVAEAVNFLKETAGAKTDQDAQAMLGPDVAGYPVDLELLKNWTSFYGDTIKQWASGRTITSPLAIFGIASVKPAAEHFSKPILILTNQMDFSGGDFFPAIMQDNRRAVVFGERTAGAGGVVKKYKQENTLLGVDAINLTATIAERVDGQPIENLGVTPDIPYAVTPADVQGGYAGYIKAADSAVSALIR